MGELNSDDHYIYLRAQSIRRNGIPSWWIIMVTADLKLVKIGGRNINNLIYADDTILMAESEEELKSLLMKVKEDHEKPGLKLNIKNKKTRQQQKKTTKLMASSPNTSCK